MNDLLTAPFTLQQHSVLSSDDAFLSIVVDGDNLLPSLHRRKAARNFLAIRNWLLGYYSAEFALRGKRLRGYTVDFFLTTNVGSRVSLARQLSGSGVAVHRYSRETGEKGYSDEEVRDELRRHGYYYDAVVLVTSDGDFEGAARDLSLAGVRVGSLASENSLSPHYSRSRWHDDCLFIEELESELVWPTSLGQLIAGADVADMLSEVR